MSQRSFRISPEYEQLEAEIFARYGIPEGTKKEQYTALLEKLHAKIVLNTDAETEKEPVTDDDISCVHFVPVQSKKGLRLFCVFKRPLSPVKFKEIFSTNFCKSCNKQQCEESAFETIEEGKAELERERIFAETEPAPKANPAEIRKNVNTAFLLAADGSHTCPIDSKKVYRKDCYQCRKHNVPKHEACAKLFFENSAVNPKAP